MSVDSIKAGQIWQVRGSAHLALVVCVFEDELFGQDLRVLPLFEGRSYLGLATADDILVPASHNTLMQPLLGLCSNAQSVAQTDLFVFRGEVTQEASEAARGLELLGIDPRVEEKYAAWRGVSVAQMDAGVDALRTGRLRLFQAWDDIRARLLQFRNAYTLEMPVSVFRAGSLFRGRGWNTLNGYTWQPFAGGTVYETAIKCIVDGSERGAYTSFPAGSARAGDEGRNE